jgi:hypothetical protein
MSTPGESRESVKSTDEIHKSPENPDSTTGTTVMRAVVIIAVIMVVIIVLVMLWPIAARAILPGVMHTGSMNTNTQVNSNQSTNVNVNTTANSNVNTSQAGLEKFRAPTKTSYMNELSSETWSALITTYNVPGVITKYDQVSGSAVFNRENGENINMVIEWLGDSHEYEFSDWKINSSMNGFTVNYNDEKSGHQFHATIEKRTSSRFDISLFNDESNIQRLIIINRR